MKNILLVLLVCILSCCPSGGAKYSTKELQHTYTRPNDSMVQDMLDESAALVMQKDENWHAYCTAVWVGEYLLASASHCPRAIANYESEQKSEPIEPMGLIVHYTLPGEIINVGQEPSTIHIGRVVRMDEVHDLTLILILDRNVPPHKVAHIAGELPGVGDQVEAVGCQGGFYFNYTVGRIAAYRDDLSSLGIPFTGPWSQTDMSAFYGSSGGPLFDSEGLLIGIASFKSSVPLMTFWVQPKAISELLTQE